MDLSSLGGSAKAYLKVPGSIEALWTGEQEEPKHWAEEMEETVCSYCPECTFQQRVYGCLFTLALGFLISIGSTFRLIALLKGDPTPFAVMYTVGNVVSLCATCFMFGPWSQAKKMFAPTRFFATVVYFGFMFTTLFLAYYPYYVPLRGVLIVVSVVLQMVALFWYTISYIPFARDMVLSCLRATHCCRSITDMPCCSEEGMPEPDAYFGGV
jgi:hypothetical protein